MNDVNLKLQNCLFLPHILVVGAFLGCGTTSRINGFGKDRLLTISNLRFWELADKFILPCQTPETIKNCRKIVQLKKMTKNENINTLRYTIFKRNNRSQHVCSTEISNKDDGTIFIADFYTAYIILDTLVHNTGKIGNLLLFRFKRGFKELLSHHWHIGVGLGREVWQPSYIPIMTSMDTRIAPDAELHIVNCSCSVHHWLPNEQVKPLKI